jgi:hypothetical protein
VIRDWQTLIGSQRVINAPRVGRPDQWQAFYVIDLRGKRKSRFSLSEEQKAANGLFATLSKERPNQ